jgi:hypothetical protein
MTSDGHSVISPDVHARMRRARGEYLRRMADVTPSSVHVVVDDVQR